MVDKVEIDPYLKARTTPERARVFLEALVGIGGLLPPLSAPSPVLTRDPKDDYLLAYAIRDRADVLVTGDEDLLALAPSIATPRIVDPGAFVRELRARGLIDQ